MGSWLPNLGGDGQSQVLLHIAYGDLVGEAASLAIWQDGKLLGEQAGCAGRTLVVFGGDPGAGRCRWQP